MLKSIKLLDNGIICAEGVQDYLQDNNDFLVIGVVGAQGVGKSTLLNLLAQNKVSRELQKKVFDCNKDLDSFDNIKIPPDLSHLTLENSKVRDLVFNLRSSSHGTNGIDLFITQNRVKYQST